MAGKEASFQLLAQIFSVSRAIQPTSRRSICPQCRTLLSLQPLCSSHRALPTGLPLRQYTTTSTLYKKSSSSSKSSRKSPSVDTLRHTNDTHIPDNAATRNRDSEIDPYDFSELNAGIAKAVARLKDALIKTKDAGRVTPEMIEQLPVELNVKGKETHGGSAHKETTKVGDIASVVQKGGRMVNVFCAEEAHVKHITSALQASPYSLAPQALSDPNNPLLITVPVPPITAETRAQARTEAKKVYDRAVQDVRTARGDAQKRHRKMELGKLVIVDELHKAHKMMEEVVRKGNDEAKKVYEASLKALNG